MGRRGRGFAMAMPPILLILGFVGLPIVTAGLYSLGHFGGLNSATAAIGQHQHEATHWWGTLGAYQEVLTNARFLRDLVMTISVTVVATTIVMVLAIGIALYQRLSNSALAKGLAVLSIVPMFIPVVIGSWAILTFYSGTGFVRTVLAQVGIDGPVWAYTQTAIVIGSVWTSLPFAVLMVTSGVQAVPDALIDAARDAGASLARTAVGIILPIAAVPIIIAVTFTSIGILGSFTVPYLTGPNAPAMLGVDIANYFQAFNQPQQSIVMAFVVFALASAIGAFYVWANFRSASKAVK